MIAPSFKKNADFIAQFVQDFDSSGKKFDDRNRNSIKLFKLHGQTINIKSFKIPNLINRIVYGTLRSSKAARSYTYAHKLLNAGVLTPMPIAYFEDAGILFGRSFYISNHLEYDLTYRELARDSKFTGNEDILRAFTRFTYELHEKNIHFLDHSPGNTLIVLKEDGYDFYLVDLNRMTFGKKLDFSTRMANFKKLSYHEEHIAIMADEYARVSGIDRQKVLITMRNEIIGFQKDFHAKKRLKRRFKFWKK